MVATSAQRISVDGVELALWDLGSGDPVLMFHGGFGDECLAVIQQPELTDNVRAIHFQRAGYAATGGSPGPASIQDMARQGLAVADQLGIEKMHIEGLSLGGTIALQFAHDYPDRVKSIALLEPGIPEVLGKYPDVMNALGTVGQLYQSGDIDGALHAFLNELAGPDYEKEMSPYLPEGWQDRMKAELAVLMQNDAPAMNSWEFGASEAARITCPVLNLTGERSRPYFHEIHELMKQWFPQAENVVLPDSTHFMLEMNPRGSAEVMARFFSKHPIG